jgi:hypothetical protein
VFATPRIIEALAEKAGLSDNGENSKPGESTQRINWLNPKTSEISGK